MGNCFGSSSRSPTPVDVTPTSHSTSRTSGSETTTGKLSNLSGSAILGESSGSGVSVEEVFREGRILEAPNLRVYTYAELQSSTRNFKSVLGEGGFGKVYKGWVEEKTLNPSKSGVGTMVAVKRLNPESVQGLEEWQSEVNFLGRLSHPNLVKLLGYCWEDKELLLVYEYMPRGSLENHLFKSTGETDTERLTWNLRLKIAIGAARGLAFLHSSEKQIIYRDFKASNILLDTNYNAKLSDFGLAKHGPTGSNSHVTTRIMGTYGYAAPEYVVTGHLYVKSDVYGFGVVLLELLTGQRAYDLNRPRGQQYLVDWARPMLGDQKRLARLMDRQLEGKYSSKAALRTAKLTLNCLTGNPKARPSMKQVVEALERIEAPKGTSSAQAPTNAPSLTNNGAGS